MIGTGTLINAAAIVGGGVIGLLGGKLMKEMPVFVYTSIIEKLLTDMPVRSM